jgi:hypothetical protein
MLNGVISFSILGSLLNHTRRRSRSSIVLTVQSFTCAFSKRVVVVNGNELRRVPQPVWQPTTDGVRRNVLARLRLGRGVSGTYPGPDPLS